MGRKIFSILMSLVICFAFIPMSASASEADGLTLTTADESGLPAPTNVKVAVTDMQQGTMQADGGSMQLNGTIASLSVTFDKTNGADSYWLAAIKRGTPGSNTWTKMASGTMPFVKAAPGQKPSFEEGDEGPNGEKITETDTTITVEKKVCMIDKSTGSSFIDEECYRKGDIIVIALEAQAGKYENFKSSEPVEVEIPFESNSKGKIFVPESEKTAINSVSLNKSKFTYNGKVQKPSVKGVKDADNNSVPKSGYAVTYSNSKSKNAGKYKMFVKAKEYSPFTGSKTKTYTIGKAKAKAPTATKKYKASKLKNKKAVFYIKPVTDGKVTYKYIKKDPKGQLSFNKKTGKVTVKKGTPAGTYSIKVKIKAAAGKNYQAFSTKTIRITVVVK